MLSSEPTKNWRRSYAKSDGELRSAAGIDGLGFDVGDVQEGAEREFVGVGIAQHKIGFQQQGHLGMPDLEPVAVGHADFERLERLERLAAQELEQRFFHRSIINRLKRRLQPFSNKFEQGSETMRNTMTRAGDVETSIMAAERMLPKVSRLQGQVLETLQGRRRDKGDGLTDRELEQLAEFRTQGPSTIRKRRGDLVAKGYVRDTGEVRDGLKVWIAIPPAEVMHRKSVEAAGLLF